ncbi:MAG: cyclic nucleotide-binding domain-containing protein [Acidobacteria bacterium]|nr:cyclic nucleotide-binding domain-containing protein [Acidobacteriota bacterium]
MKTAAIPYRVADFLKQHPPFSSMDETELVALAARGRVKFHEPDEYLCWQDARFGQFVFVIQQGSVTLWDEKAERPALRDIRGTGDVVGLERFHGAEKSQYSAKSASEVVVYALHADDFGALLARYPEARQYVEAHTAVTAGYQAHTGKPPAHEIPVEALAESGVELACPRRTTIREAARVLAASGDAVLTLTDPPAYVTAEDFVRWIAEGDGNAEAPAQEIARVLEVTVGRASTASECVLALARSGTAVAAVTVDGLPGSPIEGVVSAARLGSAFGEHPLEILRAAERARSLEELAALQARARGWMQESLAPGAMEWLAAYGGQLNRRLVERAARLSGLGDESAVWCFAGSAGRQELLTCKAPRVAVIGRPFSGLAEVLAACGFVEAEEAETGSREEWVERFAGWIRDPILQQVYLAREWFDLSPAWGPAGAFEELAARVKLELARERGFLHIMANDCLGNLPPLTFFRDVVVEESGARTDTFRLKSSALTPLVDVARVFSLASGAVLGASSIERFAWAAELLPERAEVFREAAETMKVVLYHQARAGLRLGHEGREIPLSMLSRYDRQALKSGFRSLHALLEFAADGAWLEEA